jgi:hypothetical protein
MVVVQVVRRKVVDPEEDRENLSRSASPSTPHIDIYSREGGGAPYP